MAAKKQDEVVAALLDTLISPNECDSNGESANLVDVLAKLARAAWCFHQAPPALCFDPHSWDKKFQYAIGMRDGHIIVCKKVVVDGRWVQLSGIESVHKDPDEGGSWLALNN